MKLYEKMNKGKQPKIQKKMVLIQPDQQWTKDEKLISMKLIEKDNVKMFQFETSVEYRRLQQEFRIHQMRVDIQAMYDFHIRNPYHHEALMVLADFFKMQGKFPESTELVKKTIYSFENSFGYQFKITGDIPFSRLDYENEDNKLAYTLSEAIQRYIDILGRKGCTRTALEYSKLLLSFDPEEDKFGVLLKIDYYALRSGEIDYFK